MPDPTLTPPENVPFYKEVVNWFITLATGMFLYIFRGINSKMKKNSNAISDLEQKFNEHVVKTLQEQEKFMTKEGFHEYMEKELKPTMNAGFRRVDDSLKKFDGKVDKLIEQTADVIKRDEFKTEIKDIYGKVDEVEKNLDNKVQDVNKQLRDKVDK